MNIYRCKKTKHLYTIEHLIHDIHHLNKNAFAGIYAYPFLTFGDKIIFYSQNHDECNLFVSDNFELVAGC